MSRVTIEFLSAFLSSPMMLCHTHLPPWYDCPSLPRRTDMSIHRFLLNTVDLSVHPLSLIWASSSIERPSLTQANVVVSCHLLMPPSASSCFQQHSLIVVSSADATIRLVLLPTLIDCCFICNLRPTVVLYMIHYRSNVSTTEKTYPSLSLFVSSLNPTDEYFCIHKVRHQWYKYI